MRTSRQQICCILHAVGSKCTQVICMYVHSSRERMWMPGFSSSHFQLLCACAVEILVYPSFEGASVRQNVSVCMHACLHACLPASSAVKSAVHHPRSSLAYVYLCDSGQRTP